MAVLVMMERKILLVRAVIHIHYPRVLCHVKRGDFDHGGGGGDEGEGA